MILSLVKISREAFDKEVEWETTQDTKNEEWNIAELGLSSWSFDSVFVNLTMPFELKLLIHLDEPLNNMHNEENEH